MGATHPSIFTVLVMSMAHVASCFTPNYQLHKVPKTAFMMIDNSHGSSVEDPSSKFPLIIPTKRVPIHLYAPLEEVEGAALDQLIRLAESPIPTDFVSAMPDVHLGKGVTIGTVFASDKYVCPNAVGVDIGCGMAWVPFDDLYKDDLSHDDKNTMQQLLKERIPTGANSFQSALPGTQELLDEMEGEVEPTAFLKSMLTEDRTKNQLGTLGGGNHFLEVVHEEETGRVGVMLHSGSRGLGNRCATHYNTVAKELLEKQGADTNALNGLNYMLVESEEGQNYLKDMEFCQRYAFQNRAAMKKTMLDVVQEVTGRQALMDEAINIHHNYCTCESCGDKKLWVTRKGATSAKLGEMGIIPGSMGTGSYITRGRGNPLSWSSSSHGAGRRMSRTQANEKISQEDFEASMQGIVCDTDPQVRDEAPQAYKDLNVVMENQKSLTDIVYRLLPLVNVKGIEKISKSQIPKNERIAHLKRLKIEHFASIEKAEKRCNPGKKARSMAALAEIEEKLKELEMK